MLKKIIYAVVIVAILATVAYYRGWLSPEGEKAYTGSREKIKNTAKKALEKGSEVLKD